MVETMPKNRNILRRGVTLAAIMGGVALPGAMADASPNQEPATTASHRRHSIYHIYPRIKFAGPAIEGQASTFGYPSDKYTSSTADQWSNTNDQCIALRHQPYDHPFLLTIDVNNKKYQGITYQCDDGPQEINDRVVDVTGAEAKRIGIDEYNFPTDQGSVTVRELRGPKVTPSNAGTYRNYYR
jgi:hypothetical protein